MITVAGAISKTQVNKIEKSKYTKEQEYIEIFLSVMKNIENDRCHLLMQDRVPWKYMDTTTVNGSSWCVWLLNSLYMSLQELDFDDCCNNMSVVEHATWD